MSVFFFLFFFCFCFVLLCFVLFCFVLFFVDCLNQSPNGDIPISGWSGLFTDQHSAAINVQAVDNMGNSLYCCRIRHIVGTIDLR